MIDIRGKSVFFAATTFFAAAAFLTTATFFTTFTVFAAFFFIITAMMASTVMVFIFICTSSAHLLHVLGEVHSSHSTHAAHTSKIAHSEVGDGLNGFLIIIFIYPAFPIDFKVWELRSFIK